jgi:hypothetical protein
VDQVFQNNGLTPPALQQQTTGQTQGAHHHHHHGGGAGQSSSANASQQSSATNAQSGAISGVANTSGSQQTSNQLIANLLSQISGASGGNQSISGSLLDLQA